MAVSQVIHKKEAIQGTQHISSFIALYRNLLIYKTLDHYKIYVTSN